MSTQPPSASARSRHRGSIVSGFELERFERVPECDALARIFTHRASGARLLALSAPDPKKLFGVTFRTPARDDSGVTHVVEHLVLRGSRRFPTTSVFAEMARSGRAYATASTSEDRTTYAVGATDPAELRHLMDVQVDAVLHPLSLSVPALLEQEIGGRDGAARRDAPSGVAYNEALGSWGSPEQVLHRSVRRALFPDSAWRYTATGDPQLMRRLTVADVRRAFRRHYRPSHCYLFLYGDGDLEGDLRSLDAALPRHRAEETAVSEERPQRRTPLRAERGRGLPDTRSGVAYWSVSYVLGRAGGPEERIAFQALELLLGRLVGRAAGGTGLEANVSCTLGLGPQPYLSVVGTDRRPDDARELRRAVTAMFDALASAGIPRDRAAAAISSVEFALRDPHAPGTTCGLSWQQLALDGWFYDGDPLAYLKYSAALRRIRSGARRGYFERIIRERIVRNERSVVVHVPS